MAASELTVLGIETSCDETAAAVVRRPPAGGGVILAEAVLSQSADHAPYAGVVPEIAARAHLSHLDRLIAQTMAKAGLRFTDLDGVAATGGPGLIGGLLTGLSMAKAIALGAEKPLLAVNHLEGHALTPRLAGRCEFPYLLLLVSGGHTQFQIVEGVGCYHRIGATIDDALGEAFDKTAKLLGLGYPGGPEVERRAKTGDAERFAFPRPLKGKPGCNFSFSGLKTAVRGAVLALGTPSSRDIADICAGFQAAVADTLTDRGAAAMRMFRDRHGGVVEPVFVAAGGVAANTALRRVFETLCLAQGFHLSVPPLRLCTDNAAMIAWAGAERLALGLTDDLDAPARPRWPLDPHAQRLGGAGVKA